MVAGPPRSTASSTRGVAHGASPTSWRPSIAWFPRRELATSFPTDPGLRFYAPRALVQFQAKARDEPRRCSCGRTSGAASAIARGDAFRCSR
jgi:hypothetical protein